MTGKFWKCPIKLGLTSSCKTLKMSYDFFKKFYESLKMFQEDLEIFKKTLKMYERSKMLIWKTNTEKWLHGSWASLAITNIYRVPFVQYVLSQYGKQIQVNKC